MEVCVHQYLQEATMKISHGGEEKNPPHMSVADTIHLDGFCSSVANRYLLFENISLPKILKKKKEKRFHLIFFPLKIPHWNLKRASDEQDRT